MKNQERPLVAIRCITYNHESYIRDALEGFVKQNTDFPFVAIVHDDASTDGTADIIREYVERYPEIIKPIYEQENQYSKPGNPLGKIMQKAITLAGVKYVAMCEGDDYWTDPNKLQKQVDFLETHPDYSMVVTNAEARSEDKTKVLWSYDRFKEDSDISIDDLILGGGGYLATATFVFRAKLYENRPYPMTNLYVGDYPLQIYMGHMGKVRYLNINTTVYRWGAANSWSVKNELIPIELKKTIWEKHKTLINVMDDVTEHKYEALFKEAWLQYLFYDYTKAGDKRNAIRLWWKMKHPFKKYGWRTFVNIHGLSLPFRVCRKLSKVFSN